MNTKTGTMARTSEEKRNGFGYDGFGSEDILGPPEKVCRVCGDKAYSFNFGVVTCLSCKAFFRRHRLNEKEMKCPFEDNCVINIHTRRHCKKCRLRKCFKFGMTIEGHKRRRRTTVITADSLKWEIEIRRDEGVNANERPQEGNDNNSEMTTNDEVSMVTDEQEESGSDELMFTVVQQKPSAQLPISNGHSEDQCRDDSSLGLTVSWSTDMDGSVAGQSEPLQGQSDGPNLLPLAGQSDGPPFLPLAGQSEGPCRLPLAPCCIDSASCWTSDSSGPSDRGPSSWESGCKLPLISSLVLPSELKYIRLEELLIANNLTRTPSISPDAFGTACMVDFGFDKFIYVVRHLYGTVIKQHSRLKAFKHLSLNDRLSIMKTRAGVLSFIRVLSNVDPLSRQLEMRNVNTTKWVKSDSRELYSRFRDIIPRVLRCNEMVMVILSALAVFDPESPYVQDKGRIGADRAVYLHLLKDVLENQYGDRRAQIAFDCLTSWLNHVCRSSESKQPSAVFQLNPSTFDISHFQLIVQ